MWLPAAEVARLAVLGLEQGKGVVIPGFANRSVPSFARSMPPQALAAFWPGSTPPSSRRRRDAVRSGKPRCKRPVVLIITGLRVGKSTTARLVAQRFEHAACLASDWFWTTIVKGFVPPWQVDADTQNRGVMRAVAESSAALATSGYAVVIDGVIVLVPRSRDRTHGPSQHRHALSRPAPRSLP